MIRKHSMTIRGHRTSVSVEDAFWQVLKEIAERKAMPLAALVAEIDGLRKPDDNLSSAIRIHVLKWALDARGVAERHHR
ncbi:MAG: ribbon-helix-helix domain-containing protein [Pararhizobium sp.]